MEQADGIDEIDEQLSKIFDSQVSLANPVVSISEQQVSLEDENCQKVETKDGHCYIFNYQKFDRLASRNGSEKDAERLEHDFIQLNLDVHTHTNLEGGETFKALREACCKNHSKSKYFVCCFLTHGNQNTLWAKDRSMNIDDILTLFSESSSLKGIPKIFIIQACRGNEPELAVSIESTDSGFSTETEEFPDFLIANSTYLDTISFKTCDEELEKCHGSFFIDEFCNSLEQFSSCLDLFQILTIVNYRMANNFLSHLKDKKELDKKKQMSCFTSTLRKKVEFNKKIEQFDTIDTQYFEKRRIRHGSGRDNINDPSLDLKYDVKKAKRVLFLSVVNKKIGEKSICLRKTVNSLCIDFDKRKYDHKGFCSDYKKSKLLKFLKGSNQSSEIDCLICYIAAYSRYDSICDVDGRKISKKEIVENFISQQKKSFVGKPKIFIYLLCKSLEDENLSSERFCKDYFKSTTESRIKTQFSSEGLGTNNDSVDGNIDNNILLTERTIDPNVESTNGYIGENLIPVHADILEICITVADWKDAIEPVRLFSEILEKSRTEDLLSLLTKFNFELVEKHNFFQMSNSKNMPRNSFSMTSTLTKTLFLP